MDPKLLEEFKAKRTLWIQCLLGEDRNSISQQIYEMVWNAAVFRIINEARKIISESEVKREQINGTLHHFIDNCFFDSQLLAVRRLTDASSSLQHNERAIFSLQALLIDIRDNLSLLNRENLIAAEGLEYDYEALSRRELEYGSEQSKNGKMAYWVPPELDSSMVRSRHNKIDELCGVNESQRKPSDTVKIEFIEYLIKKLKDTSADVKLYVDKNIAHLATPENRAQDKAENVSITLGSFWEAHKIICQIANFVSLYILSQGMGNFLPTPQFNHLEFIDKPLVFQEEIEVLNNVWLDFEKETNSWSSWGINELMSESKIS